MRVIATVRSWNTYTWGSQELDDDGVYALAPQLGIMILGSFLRYQVAYSTIDIASDYVREVCLRRRLTGLTTVSWSTVKFMAIANAIECIQ